MTVVDRLEEKCLIDAYTTILSTPFLSTSALIRHLGDVCKIEDFRSKGVLAHRSNKNRISSNLKNRLDNAILVATFEEGRSFNHFSKKRLKKLLQSTLPRKRTMFSFLTILLNVFYVDLTMKMGR